MGAKILIHKDEQEYIDFEPDKFLVDRDTIKIGSTKLDVIHTPGHSPGGSG